MSGDVNINYRNFVNNSHYRGHGAAIHYSYMYNAKQSSHDQFVLAINNCTFTNNKHNRSLVYIDNNRLFKYHKIIFNNSIFSNNQGMSVNVINYKIYINGKVFFHNNEADDGAGIYISDYSTVIFGEDSNVMFSQNLAYDRGGAIFLRNHSICLFHQNSVGKFNYNKAMNGGAIYSKNNSNVTFKAACNVTFTRNLAISYGGAIFSLDNSKIIFAGNTRTTVSSNVRLYGKIV